MARRVTTIACAGGVYGTFAEGRFLRLPCRDRQCPQCRYGREHGWRTIHVFDHATGYRSGWVEYEDPKTGAVVASTKGQ